MRLCSASLALLIACGSSWFARAEEPKPIPPEQFDKLHQMIKPQPGELRFHEIPWLLSVWEARKKAAEEGPRRGSRSWSGPAPAERPSAAAEQLPPAAVRLPSGPKKPFASSRKSSSP
jgi:hypothetical protein